MSENTKNKHLYRSDILYPELSYQIIGILFDVFSNLGHGYREIQYQKAIQIGLDSSGIAYKRELPVRINYKGRFLTTNYIDFLIEDKIILEIKQGGHFSKKDFEQTYNYLKVTSLKLGIVARFTRSGLKFQRVVNLY